MCQSRRRRRRSSGGGGGGGGPGGQSRLAGQLQAHSFSLSSPGLALPIATTPERKQQLSVGRATPRRCDPEPPLRLQFASQRRGVRRALLSGEEETNGDPTCLGRRHRHGARRQVLKAFAR
uniref:Uncharacterized protein n=1 Tax=Chlamydomonas euryale TaxID=1486919 RepID=A0A7R9YZ26_9CHLO